MKKLGSVLNLLEIYKKRIMFMMMMKRPWNRFRFSHIFLSWVLSVSFDEPNQTNKVKKTHIQICLLFRRALGYFFGKKRMFLLLKFE